MFDDRYRYVNANHLAKGLFPEIKEWAVDKKVPDSDSYAYREIVQCLYGWDGKEKATKMVSKDDLFYQMEIRPILYGKKENVGYLFR